MGGDADGRIDDGNGLSRSLPGQDRLPQGGGAAWDGDDLHGQTGTVAEVGGEGGEIDLPGIGGNQDGQGGSR